MLPPSSIQNSASNAGSPRTTQELARALTVDKATPVTIRQVSVSASQSSQPNQPAAATLVIQLGNQQYQLKTQQQPGQTLTAQAQALITRTADGKLLLDFLQQPASRTQANTQTEQSSRANQTPVQTAAQTTSSGPGAAATNQPQNLATPRNAPLQINLGQPQQTPLTINRPIAGQSIQVIPQAPSGTGSVQPGTTASGSTPASVTAPVQNTAPLPGSQALCRQQINRQLRRNLQQQAIPRHSPNKLSQPLQISPLAHQHSRLQQRPLSHLLVSPRHRHKPAKQHQPASQRQHQLSVPVSLSLPPKALQLNRFSS